jgi:hypothetical protein
MDVINKTPWGDGPRQFGAAGCTVLSRLWKLQGLGYFTEPVWTPWMAPTSSPLSTLLCFTGIFFKFSTHLCLRKEMLIMYMKVQKLSRAVRRAYARTARRLAVTAAQQCVCVCASARAPARACVCVCVCVCVWHSVWDIQGISQYGWCR